MEQRAQWETAGCDCCSPTVLDDAFDRLGYDVAFWNRMRRFGIELAQAAQNVIDGEQEDPADPVIVEAMQTPGPHNQ